MFEYENHDSIWRPYLDILPLDLNTPVYWTEEERELLRNTSVYEELGLEENAKRFENLSKFLHLFPNKHEKTEVSIR